MIHTANQLGTNFGPSYVYGWGLINPVGAAELVMSNCASGSLANIKEGRIYSGSYIAFPVQLASGVPFKATIAWSDPPGTPTAPALNPTNHMLVNDLDLRVISPSGTTNFPYVLNPALPDQAATTGDNKVDNVEQVFIPSPSTGTYTVQITPKALVLDDLGRASYQNVSIILSGNLPQPPTLPTIKEIMPLPEWNSIAIGWSSDVGRVYRVQSRANLTDGSWQYASSELTASTTNAAVMLDFGQDPCQFYRVVQVR